MVSGTVLRAVASTIRQHLRQWLSQSLRAAGQTALLAAAVAATGYWLSTVPEQLVLLLSLGVAAAWSRVRLPGAAERIQRGWLASVALSAGAQRALVVVLAALPAVAFAFASGAIASLVAASAAPLAIALPCAALAGFTAAVLPHPARARPYPESRYRRGAVERDGKPGLDALRHDLHAFVAARMRPEALAKVCGPLLLALPHQLSVSAVLLLVPLVAALCYAGFLLSALAPFLAGTHRWLASAAVRKAELARRLRHTLWLRFALITVGVTPFLMASAAGARAASFAFAVMVGLVLWLELVLRMRLLNAT